MTKLSRRLREIEQLVEGEPDWRPERSGDRYTMLNHIEDKAHTTYVLSFLIDRVERDLPPNGRVAVLWFRAGTDIVSAEVAAWPA